MSSMVPPSWKNPPSRKFSHGTNKCATIDKCATLVKQWQRMSDYPTTWNLRLRQLPPLMSSMVASSWKTLHPENLVFFVCAADGRVIYCDTVRTFTVVYVHDTWSVSDSEVLCSCFMQHYLYNTQHFVCRVHKLWKLSTLHVSLIPRTVQFKKLLYMIRQQIHRYSDGW